MCAWPTWKSAQFFSHILHTALFIHCRKRTCDVHAHTHTHTTSNSLPITVRLNGSDRASPLRYFVFLRQNESQMFSFVSSIAKNSQTHGNTPTHGARTDKLSATHTRTRPLPLPHVHAPTQTSNHLVRPDSFQTVLYCLSSLFHLLPPPPAVFVSVSPSSLWMPSLPLPDLPPHPLIHLRADGVKKTRRILASNCIPSCGTALGAF